MIVEVANGGRSIAPGEGRLTAQTGEELSTHDISRQDCENWRPDGGYCGPRSGDLRGVPLAVVTLTRSVGAWSKRIHCRADAGVRQLLVRYRHVDNVLKGLVVMSVGTK